MEIIKGAVNGTALKFVIPLIDTNNRPDYKSNPTLALGDVKLARYTSSSWAVSNVIMANVNPVAGMLTHIEVELTATEMTADDNTRPVIVTFVDAAGSEWDDQSVIIRLGTDTLESISDQLDAIDSSVNNINTGSAAISTASEAFTKTVGGTETNTYAVTDELDGVLHIIPPSGGNSDGYYEFDVGGNGVPTEFDWQGYAQSNGDSYAIYAYNYSTTSYDQIGEIAGSNSTSIISQKFATTVAHVGTSGADKGKVRFRFLSADGTNFATDRLLCSYAVVAQSVGYAEGAIWVDTNGSNTNTENYVDGVADNPVSTWAAAKTLSASLGINKFHIVNGSSITLDSDSSNYSIVGVNWSLSLGGQNISGAYIVGASLTGTATGSGYNMEYCDLAIGASVSVAEGHFHRCAIAGDLFLSTGTYYFDQCFSGVAGTATPSIDFGAAVANTNLNLRHYSGGIEVKNIGSNGTDNMSLEGDGQLVLNANCSGGSISIRGNFGPISDNAGGVVTLVELGNITSMQGKSYAATSFNRVTDSLEAISDSAIGMVLTDIVDGSIDVQTAMKMSLAYNSGKIVRTGDNYAYRNNADSSDVFILTGASSGRTRS